MLPDSPSLCSLQSMYILYNTYRLAGNAKALGAFSKRYDPNSHSLLSQIAIFSTLVSHERRYYLIEMLIGDIASVMLPL